ncbi:NTPase KAP family P-loop domain-containing protein 1-like isoform X2 [Antechinus flavipes]|uniref:NTPase KAP family P-loop domain-containing protein 1-like isoform X2 n=1 Tax=Antechinus flavipes TaxID=38775 RepID=UPI002235BA5B|nr:NTPase KAP family P-loop domain-containing protein 1-like isoform X2 [Antechinus flavipes]
MLLLLKIAICVPTVLPDKTIIKTRYIFVPFQAWEFAGSDFLWAGLVTTLCGCIEKKYWLPLIFYKLFGIPVQDSTEASRKQTDRLMWRCFKRVVFFLLVIILILGGLCSLILDSDISDTKKGLLIPGVPIGLFTLWSLGCGIYKFFRNSKESIKKLMDNSKCSNQLGFMHAVKKEVEVLTKFLEVLGVYNKQHIKVVLQISHLDACPPEKVMGALEALHILHSDPKAPFISILAADSKIIAESVERSKKMDSLIGSGYQYLNQFITLPFSMTHWNRDDKIKLLEEIKCSEKRNRKESQRRQIDLESRGELEANVTEELEKIINDLEGEKISKFLPHNRAHMERVVYTSWITLELRKQKFGDKLEMAPQQTQYMEEEEELLKRKQAQDTKQQPEDDPHEQIRKEVIAWVLLANEWPFRVTWMLQCAEDDEQWRVIHGQRKNDPDPHVPKQEPTAEAQWNLRKDNTKSLYYVESQGSIKLEDDLEKAFTKVVVELDSVKEELRKLMELDKDPEIFLQMLRFLKKEFSFTVEKALQYWGITTNLDRSLKRHLELIQGRRTLKQASMCHRQLPLSLLKMSTDEVCQAMNQNAKQLGISETNMKQYIEKIRKENLNGKALVYSLNSEIRQTLNMTLGDWVSFSINFLNVLPEANSSLAASWRLRICEEK